MEKKPDRSEIIAMTLLFALTLVLTVLKVTRTVSLPWLWVLGPLWLFRYGGRQGQFGVGSWHHAPFQKIKSQTIRPALQLIVWRGKAYMVLAV